MCRPSLPFVLLISFLSVVFSKADSSYSAITLEFCNEVVERFGFIIEVKGNFSDEIPGSVSRPTRANSEAGYSNKIWSGQFFSGGIRRMMGFGKGYRIYQNNVDSVKVISNDEICIQAMAVDTIIIVDQNTSFRESCAGRRTGLPPCKELNSEVQPLPVCPEQLTKLLKREKVISTEPLVRPGARDFKVPKYDIIQTMGDASSAIVVGLVDLGRKVLKSAANNFKTAATTSLKSLGQTLGTLATFMKAMGPLASIFGGILSIATTFLTPNPFDEMAKYLEKEFDEVHRRLTHIQSDIVDLKRVVQYENKVCGIGRKLEAIRYSLRRYEKMVQGLSNHKVCGQSNFLNQTEVKDFMKQYEDQYVDDSLLDLYGVEFGEVLEATSLLRPLMRAYCLTDPNKVQRFMEDISVYASAGFLVHSAFQDLRCRRDGDESCEDAIKLREKQKWMKKAHKFLTKAEALREAASNPMEGLKLDIKDDLNTTIYKVISYNVHRRGRSYNYQTSVLFNQVNKFITNKIGDINDWPEACLVNQDDKTVIVYVGQFHNREDSLPYRHQSWELPRQVEIDISRLHVYTKAGQRGFKKDYYKGDPGFEKCDGIQCDVTKDITVDSESSDYVMFILYNPKDFHIQSFPEDFPANTKESPHPELIVRKLPVHVLYVERGYLRYVTWYFGKVIIAKRDYPASTKYYAFVEI